MADDLPEVDQRFEADTRPYIAAVRDAIAAAREFALANAEAAAAAGVDDAALGRVADEIGRIGLYSRESAHALEEIRLILLEGTDAANGFAGAVNDAASAEKDLRDSALEAAAAVDHQQDEASGGVGIFRRLAFALLAAMNAAGTGGAGGGGLTGALAALGPGMSAVAIAAGGLLVTALFPVLATLPLIAAGIGGFTALAMPELSKVFTAITATGKAAHTAMQALTPAERELVRQTEPLRDQFAALQRAIQPSIIKAFAEGIRIVKDLMPAFVPLVRAAGSALDGLLKNIAGWLSSGSGQKFIAWMQRDGPHAIETFGRVVWDVIQGVGRAFAFLNNVGETMRRNWFRYMHDISEGIDAVREAWIKVGHEFEARANVIIHDFDTARHAIASWGHDVAAAFDTARHTVASFGHDVAHTFDEFRHAQGQFGAFEHDIEWGFDRIRHAAAITLTEIGRFTVTGITDIGRFAVTAVTDIGRFTATVLADIGRFVASGLAAFGRFVAGAVQWFAGLPGRIVSAQASLPGMLFAAGQRAIQGLINGILSMAGAVGSAVASIASKVAGFFGLSPAREGPLAGLGAPETRGKHFAQALAAGMLAQMGAVHAAAYALAQAAVPGSGVGGYQVSAGGAPSRVAAGTGGGAPNITINLHIAGSVIAQQQLRGVVQQAVLEAWTRNRGTGFVPYGYGLR